MMKKLMLSKGKAMACLILICLFLTQSCRKEHFAPLDETKDLSTQLIKQETIQKWIDNNAAAKFLSPDWSKARQAVIEGKNIVRVPLLNVDKFSEWNKTANLQGKSSKADLNNAKTNSNLNYSNEHPPELFFIQDNNQLKTYLLNFIPKENTKEFGEDGIWTGTLLEWNLSGDTIFVQKIEKNVLEDKYIAKLDQNNLTKNINTTVKSQKLQSLNGLKDKQVSSFFGWLGNLIENVIGWIGNLFGLSYYVGGWDSYGYWEAYRLDTINIFDSTGSGGGGSGGNVTVSGSYTAAGGSIYGSFMVGYTSAGSTPISQILFTEYKIHQGGPNNPPAPPNADGIEIMEYLSLTEAAQYYILSEEAIPLTKLLRQYLNVNGWNPENLEFAAWMVEYSRVNPNSIESFRDAYLSAPESLNLYKLDDLTKLQYPRFAKMVNQLKNYLLDNPKVINGIRNYTGYTREQVLDLATPGKGPKLIITDNLTVYQTGKPDAQYLRWKMDSSGTNPILDSNGNKIKEDRIFINKATVAELENGLLQLNPAVEKKMQGLAFLLAITIFHETVHYGRQWNELNKQGDWTEYGWQFEDNYLGFRVYNDNAGDLVNYNFKLR